MNEVEFCACGRALITMTFGGTVVKECPRHGTDITRKTKVLRGRFSGKTARMKGKYEDY